MVVLVVQQDTGGGDDVADAQGAEADSAQRLKYLLQQRVSAFTGGTAVGVQRVDGTLIGERAVGDSLDWCGQHVTFAFVAQVGERGVRLVGPLPNSGSASGSVRSAVVSCSRLGRTPEVHSGQLGQPDAVEKPAQYQHRLPIAAQRPSL